MKNFNYDHFPSEKWRKILFIMGLKLTILFCSVGVVVASPIYSQQTKHDISYEKMSLTAVLEDLKLKTGYHFFYFEGIVPKDVTVSVDLRQADINQILGEILIKNGLTYKIDNGIVSVSRTKSDQAQIRQQPATAKGKVVDDKGKTIIGATVILKGTSMGTITDANGNFTLLIPSPEGAVLKFSFLGKESVEVRFSGQEEIKVTLKEAKVNIEEVVVTGIFNRPRESYTGAVTTITEGDIKLYKGQNLLATLRNIDPVINIVADNIMGSNPNREYEINIRGNSSLPSSLDELNQNVGRQLNTPLIIMDGFEITLQKLMDFNDEEIESINILKDASATSIYGSRGANGVIVIKTKSPKAGKLNVFVQAGLNLEVPDLSSYDLLGAKDKLRLERMVGLYDRVGDPDQDRALKNIYNLRWDEALKGETDWLKEPVRIGTGQKINVRLEGGSEEFRWSAAVGNNAVRGAMKGSQRNTTNLSITLSYQFKNLIFRNSASYDYTLADNGSYGSFASYASINPYNRARDKNGEIIESWQGWATNTYIYNPLANAKLKSKDENRTHTISDIFSIDWKILEGLNVRGQLGVSKSFNTKHKYVPAEHSFFKVAYYTTGDGFFRKGTYDYTDGESMSIDGMVTLSYSKTFAEKHVLYTGLSTSIAQNESGHYLIKVEGLLNQNFNDLTNALQYADGTTPSGDDSRSSRIGFTGNVNYTFDNRYFVDASFRFDGSSQFGTNNKYAPFWSLGVGWNIHNEEFMKNQIMVDLLRLRLAYGQTGSQQFSAYQAKSMYKILNSSKYVYWTVAELMGLGNPDLKWQRTDQWNGGIDAHLFNKRVTAGLEVYYKETSNLLSSIDIPQAQGFRSYAENVGKVRNYGFEGMLGGYVFQDSERRIFWNINAKLAYTKNEVTKLSDAIKEQVEALRETSEDDELLYEGKSQKSIYAVRSLGIDPIDGQEIFLDKYGNITKTWRAGDRVYCGVAEPTYRGIISNMFTYRDFILNFSFAYHWGGKQYNKTLINKVEMSNYSMQNNVDKRVFSDRWQNPGDIKFFKGYSNNATRSSSRFVMDDNVFQLQSVSLQYRWHTPFVQNRLRTEAINFSVNMSDIFYLSSIKRERGIDYPFARNIQMSVSLLF